MIAPTNKELKLSRDNKHLYFLCIFTVWAESTSYVSAAFSTKSHKSQIINKLRISHSFGYESLIILTRAAFLTALCRLSLYRAELQIHD